MLPIRKVTAVTVFMENAFYKIDAASIKPHDVSHLILTKLCHLIYLYSVVLFLFFFNNFLTVSY